MSTPPSSQAQQNASVATPPKLPHQVLSPTINSDPFLSSIENIEWNRMQHALGFEDQFTFPFDIDLEQEQPLPDFMKIVADEPQFKVHEYVEYHPDPNLRALPCVVVDVHPVLTGQVALYAVAFTDRSMRVNVPQYDLHPLNISPRVQTH